jgi:hypothetical protein
LQKYAELDGSILALGIFWVRWNLWTLVPASRIPRRDNARKISLGEALKMNCSAALGDFTIATRPPFRIVVRTDSQGCGEVSGDGVSREYKLTIRAVEIYAGDTLITDKTDKKIFDFLREFGTWEDEDSIPLMNGDRLEGIEFRWQPRQEENQCDDSQPFRMIGSLSSMFSTWFRSKALDGDGRPSQTRIEVVPGFLSQMIPNGYHGTHLPLWIFVQQPNFDE